MPKCVHLTAADVRRVPWKNGRGFTEELAVGPAGASFEQDDFRWRISKARVDAAGPFSVFPGIDRTLVVTEGDGLALDHGGAAPRMVLRRLLPYAFSGDWTTTAELQGGPVADFNLLVCRGVGRGGVRVLTPGVQPEHVTLHRGDAFVHVLRGAATVRRTADGPTFALACSHSLAIRDLPAAEEFAIVASAPDCLVLLATIHAA